MSRIRIQVFLLAFAGLVATIAVAAAPRSAADGPATLSLDDLAFLEGSWRAEFHGSVLEETFSAPRAGTIMGVFRWIDAGRTTMTEHMVIEQQDDGVRLLLRHFDPGSKARETDAMVFRLVAATDDRAVLEDSTRAFPRRIVYERRSPDVLVARLEGTRDGAERTMEFVYRSISMTTTATDALTEAGKSLGYGGALTIALKVKDLGKAIDFYENVVGFKTLYRMDEMGWAEVTTSVPNVAIGLSQVEDTEVGSQTPTFSVDDLDRARKILEDRGAKFDGDTIEIPGMVKLATFFDLDGNPLMLSQSLSDEMP